MKIVSLKFIGRVFVGLGLTGIGLIHFAVPGFQPDILPISAEDTWQIFPYLMGTVLTVSGIAISVNKGTPIVSLLVGLLLLLFLVLGHLPIRFNNDPSVLAKWTPTVKLMALAGGLLVLSTASADRLLTGAIEKLHKLARYGKYLFAWQLIIFGIAHFVYADGLQNIVPSWIPARLLWVYLTGIALMGSGISIFLNIRVHLVSLLLATTLFIWLVILHVPLLINHPFGNGSSAVSLLQCLTVCGTALLICDLAKTAKSKYTSISKNIYQVHYG